MNYSAGLFSVLLVVLGILMFGIWDSFRARSSRIGRWRPRIVDLAFPPDAPVLETRDGAFESSAREVLGSATSARQSKSGDAERDIQFAKRHPSDAPTAGARVAGPSSPDGPIEPSDFQEAAFFAAPAVAVSGVTVGETFDSAAKLDESLLDALRQLSGQQVDGLADFRNLQAARDYQLDSLKLRGTIGEQKSASIFSDSGAQVEWPTGGRTEFGPSNNPGWDLRVDGQEINVKITQDASEAARTHFAEWPDIPMVVNEDAKNIPEDAVWVGPDEAVDPEDLIGENVVIVQEGLLLGGITDMQADAQGAADPLDVEAAADAVPFLGVLIAAVRSGVHEGRLLADDKTDLGRALKNVAIDTGSRGGGGVGGAWAGAQAGAMVDAAFGGATLGMGTALGALAGVFGGAFIGGKAAKSMKSAPLREANVCLQFELQRYEQAVNEAAVRTRDEITAASKNAQREHRRAASTVHEAYLDLLGQIGDDLARESLVSPSEVDAWIALAEDETTLALSDYRARVSRWGLRRRLRARLQQAEISQRAWQAEVRRVGSAHKELAAPKGELMDVLMAAESGRATATTYLTRVAESRSAAHKLALAGNQTMVDLVAASRRQHLALLHLRVSSIRQASAKQLEPEASCLRDANARVVAELRKAGIS